jgi:putative transposase
MPGPRPRPIVLTDRQRQTLEHVTRRRSSTQGLVRRARIVLAADEGHNNEQIARRLGINRETARLWRRVWSDAAELLAAAEEEEKEETSEKALRECVEEVLADAPRSGAPATFAPEQVVQIVALACEAPREGSGRPVTHWTPRELADEAVKRGIVGSISPRSVGRFLGRGASETPQDALLAQQRALSRTAGLRRGG